MMTILETYRKGGRIRATCRCHCGVVKDVSYDNVKRLKSCGCSRRTPEYKANRALTITRIRVGQKLGKLLVTDGPSLSADCKAIFLCRCDCGTEKRFSSCQLGKRKSCGCGLKDHLARVHAKIRKAPGASAAHALYLNNKAGAIKRGRSWEITEDDFLRMSQQMCFYCGSEPANVSDDPRRFGIFVYNGIDRYDNAEGYTLQNCVTACRRCNFLKQKMSAIDFIRHVNKIATTHTCQS